MRFDTLNPRHNTANPAVQIHRLTSLWNGIRLASACANQGEALMLRLSQIYFATLMAISVAIPTLLAAQSIQPADPRPGNIAGTVTDVNGDPVLDATVILKSFDGDDRRTILTLENGFFEFHDAESGVPYEISVSAKDFADWTSPTITLESGQFKIVTGVQLQIPTQVTQVDVRYDPVQIATEQLKNEEQQRVFGFIPNFYVSYEANPAPLTAKMKFQLAFKVSTDPVTAIGIALVSGSKQGGDTPNYGQGWGAYGKRFGAVAGDGFSDIMIGGAILPSLLHQDPRYFYQGTGTTGSRIRHAMLSAFIAKGDNGKWQPNYSTVGGDLASAGISNLYYPRSNRGVGLVFGNFALGTVERMSSNLAEEFLLGKVTRRSGHMK
jgi:Carboxypeptidase regulatory-like domain